MSTYEITCIAKLIPKLYLLKGKRKGLCWFFWTWHLFAISASHTWRKIPDAKKTNVSEWICGFYCTRNSNVHHSCSAEKVHSNLLPLCLCSPFCPTPSVSLMFWTVRQGSLPFVVLERTRWRSGGDFRESDRWESSRRGWWRRSIFKGEGIGKIDHRLKTL